MVAPSSQPDHDADDQARFPTFVFVAQAGSLERMAVLLAASIRRFCGNGPEIVATMPTPESDWGGSLDPKVLAFFERLDVRIEPIVNPFGRRYPIGNKFPCLAVDSTSPELVFLDTDIVMLHSYPQRVLFRHEVEAVPETNAHVPLAAWEIAYQEFGLDLPDYRMTPLASGEEMLPLFNGGFVATTRGPELGQAWAEASLGLDRSSRFPEELKRWGLDQWALPIAARLIGSDIAPISMAFNFPSWAFPVGEEYPVFWHYRRGRLILKQRRTFDEAAATVQAYPEIRDILSDDPELKHIQSGRMFNLKRALIAMKKVLRLEERRSDRHMKER